MRYLPINEAREGMVLGEAVTLTERSVLRLSFPAGHALTETSLRQLRLHHASSICVSEADPRSDEQVATDTATAAAEVMRIFSGADLSQPEMAALFDRILAYRSK